MSKLRPQERVLHVNPICAPGMISADGDCCIWRRLWHRLLKSEIWIIFLTSDYGLMLFSLSDVYISTTFCSVAPVVLFLFFSQKY